MIVSPLPDAAPLAPLPSASLSSASLPPFWGRMETLWLWMAPLCALLYTLCLPLAPNDLWYHVRAGELISRGAIPTQNLMSSAVAQGAPYYYQSWLSELALFRMLQIGGLSGLVLLRAFCVTGALALVATGTFRLLLRLKNPPSRLAAARLTAFSAVVALAMLSNNVDLRPQTFSTWLCGLWIFGALEFRASNPAKRRVWAAFLLVLTMVWANTHGAFIIAILGFFALALGDFCSQRERFRASLGLALAAGAVALVNPRGAALYAYVAGLSRDQISQQWVQEWKSPGFDDWHSALFWLASATIFALWWRTRRSQKGASSQINGWHCVLALFWVMAARDQRSIIWFALVLVPVLASFCADSMREKRAIAPVALRAAQWINAFLLIFLLALPLALLPQWKANWPWPDEFKARFAPTPALFGQSPPLVLERTTPVVAAQYLSQNPPRGRLFTDMVCGSYLTYAGRGQIVPLCDPRIELFPATFWEDYLRLSSGPADAPQILRARGFSDALLDRDSMPALVERLRAHPRWRVVAHNGSTLLFRNF